MAIISSVSAGAKSVSHDGDGVTALGPKWSVRVEELPEHGAVRLSVFSIDDGLPVRVVTVMPDGSVVAHPSVKP